MNSIYISIIVVALVVAFIGFLFYRGQKKTAYKIILVLVEKMEASFGTGQGNIKYVNVVSIAYPMLPIVVKMFLTMDELDNMIEKAVDELELKLNKEINKEE